MKLASLKDGRDGRLVVVSRDLTRCADASAVAPTLQAALDDWDAALPRLTEIADSLEAEPHRAYAVRSGEMRLALAARLSMARRLGLCESRRAGAAGEGRRSAGLVLDRSADVSGHFRHRDRAARPDRARRRSLGHRYRGRSGRDPRRRADGRDPRTGGEGDPADHAGQRRDAAQHHRRRNSPRASAFCSRSRRRPSRRSRSRRTNSARPGTAPRSICRC